MANHNFQTQGPKAYYNPKGAYVWCHSEADLARAKEQGYTSVNYVRSEWPKAAFHKKTGETKSVGKLDNTKEQNDAAVVALGDDWTLDYVAVPEPVKAAEPGNGSMDLIALASMMADVKLVVKRVEELEEAAIQADALRVTLERRLAELEGEPVGESKKKAKLG